jgi:hypothetical protein
MGALGQADPHIETCGGVTPTIGSHALLLQPTTNPRHSL